MAEIQLSSVQKVYPNGFEAVKSFDLTIADGEFTVLVGPSGCGKSTTLRMLAGLEEVTGGQISIGGRVVNDVHPKDRDIAMVFQNYALYPHMTVYKNMAFALKLRRMPKNEIDTRVRETAKTLGIEDLLDRKPRQLSGGQRQRVAVGRAIVREPKAFLFDEPLSNLDAKLRVTMRAELKSLHRRLGTTSVYVTHDQEEAMTLGDRIVVMAEGLIQQVGAPLEVYRKPVNRFTASFVGSPPMNFIEGLIEVDDQGTWFAEEGASGDRIRLAGDLAAAASDRRGSPMVLGVRPQALQMASGGAGGGSRLHLTVDVVEPLGDAVDVFGTTTGGRRLVARIDAHGDVPVGGTIELALDVGGTHLFEPGEYGASLLHGAAPVGA